MRRSMLALIDKIGKQGISREEARRYNREDRAPRHRRARRYTFRYQPDDEAFQLRLTFAKPEVESDELIDALENLIKDLRRKAREEAAAAKRSGAGASAGSDAAASHAPSP